MQMIELSPLDGRYKPATQALRACFSESAYIAYQARVEQAYLKRLLEELSVKADLKGFMRPLTTKEIELCRTIETRGAKGIPATNHDLKAIEYVLKQRLKPELKEYVHFGLTSEDTSNLALGLMLKDGLKVVKQKLFGILERLETLSNRHSKTVMLGRTHGQFAAPTTFGKEMRVFADRLRQELSVLESVEIQGKLNGAVGTLAALKFAFPEHDWKGFSKGFVEELELSYAEHTTQLLHGDSYVRVFSSLHLINSILLGFCQDIWRYISDNWLTLKAVPGEVGSSVMPHKLNPIDFENAEGNLKLANGLLEVFLRELPVSRLQRDLSDKTIKRNFGVVFGHALVAYSSIVRGMDKLEPNAKLMGFYCEQHPEVLAEAYQTELRKHMPGAYELLLEFTRGKLVTIEELHRLVDILDVPEAAKAKLKKLKPAEYL
jgi:adenylosuccinate lyase